MGVQLLGQRAYDRMSITELARAAGISKGLLYHYFDTKSEFVVAVLRQSREEIQQRMTFDPTLEPAARIDANLDAFLAFVEDHAEGFLALARARSGEDDAIRAELAAGREWRIGTLIEFAAQLADCERGEVESPALRTVLAGWVAYSEEVVTRWLRERQLVRDDVRQLLRHALMAALASVGSIDDGTGAARLAEAAERAMHVVAPSP